MSARDSVKSTVLGALSPRMEPLGFVLERGTTGRFARKTSIGQDLVLVTFAHYRDASNVSVSVGVRVDAIEDIANKYNEALPARERKRTVTMSADLRDELTNGRSGPWQISHGSEAVDALGIADAVVELLESVGLPWFKRLVSLPLVYEALAASNPTGAFAAGRCMRAIAAAHLLGLGDQSTLIAKCDASLRGDPMRYYFEHLASDVLSGKL